MLQVFVILLLSCLTAGSVIAQAPPAVPLEFSPYRTLVWLDWDPHLPLAPMQRRAWENQLAEGLEQRLGAALDARLVPSSPLWASRLQQPIDALELSSWLEDDRVLVVSTAHPQAETLRSLQAILEAGVEVACDELTRRQVEHSREHFESDSGQVEQLLDLLRVRPLSRHQQPAVGSDEPPPNGALTEGALTEGQSNFPGKSVPGSSAVETQDEVELAGLLGGELPAAIVPRSVQRRFASQLRLVPTNHSWQLDSLLVRFDKLIVVQVRGSAQQTEIALREIDATTRLAGPLVRDQVPADRLWGTSVASLIARALVPIGRVESVIEESAVVRLKAAQLLPPGPHPLRIDVGDCLEPILRIEDRTGTPRQTGPISWTYIVVREASPESSRLQGQIVSGLQRPLDRVSRTTSRWVRRVQLQQPATELRVVLRGEGVAVRGAEVFRRTVGTVPLELVGRTDWEGSLRILAPAEPWEVQQAVGPTAATDAPRTAADADAAESSDTPASTADGNDTPRDQATDPSDSDPSDSDPVPDSELASAAKRIPLRVPLHLYYIRSGGLVLAKLPVIPGHHPQLIATVADDGRRLEFEAQLRGIQGEILDATSQQRILAMRMRRLLEAGQPQAAEQLMGQWRRILTVEQVNVRLQELQRRIISESGRGGERGGLTAAAQRRLERMIQVARQQAQQHLTPELEREVLRELRGAGQPAAP